MEDQIIKTETQTQQPQQSQPQTIIVKTEKSIGMAMALAFFFGPIGMLYSTITGAIVMFLINVVVGILTLGFGLLFTWPINLIWAYFATKSYNEKLLGSSF